MDGLQFLKNLMRLRPMPVVMVSSLTQRNAAVTLEALALGAVDFVSKPEIDIASKLKEYASEIIEKVKVARLATVTQLVDDGAILGRNHSTSILSVAKTSNLHFKTTDQIIAIGASTGGTEAIREVLERLPVDTPGTVIVQHIPGMFSGPFAERMNKCSAMTVCEAQDGLRVLHGHAYIAPGDSHLSLRRDGARYYCVLSDHDPVNRHRPSVDVLFHSVAQYVGKNAVGVILTGMGKDGAAGLKAMREAGANTVVQDEASSVVWGMPGAAVALNAADEVLSLTKIPNKIMSLYQEKRP